MYYNKIVISGTEFPITSDGLIINPHNYNVDADFIFKFHIVMQVANLLIPFIYMMPFRKIKTLNDAAGAINNLNGGIIDLRMVNDLYSLCDTYKIEIPDDIALLIEAALNKVQYQRPDTPRQEIKRDKSKGFIYLIQSPTGAYKIGRTIDPDNRLKTFGVKLPFEVEYIHVFPSNDMIAHEKQLHNHFSEKRINGEWFDLSPEDIAYIKSIKVM